MNILQELLAAQGGNIVEQLASQFGVNGADAEKALANLLPAIAGGIKKSASSKKGLEELLSKVQSNQELRESADNPSVLNQPQATQAGNEILGQIFGSKEVSRTVAGKTASATGLDLGMLKKMLPLVAGLVMSQLNNKGQRQEGVDGLGGLLGTLAGAAQSQKRGGLGGLLGGLLSGGRRQQKSSSNGLESLLDFDGDGNIADDVLDLAKKMF